MGFKEGLRGFQKIPKKFQGCFDEILALQFCWCMDLIAATRAEGGLVYFQYIRYSNSFLRYYIQKYIFKILDIVIYFRDIRYINFIFEDKNLIVCL